MFHTFRVIAGIFEVGSQIKEFRFWEFNIECYCLMVEMIFDTVLTESSRLLTALIDAESIDSALLMALDAAFKKIVHC